jgi:hypothetical protein
VRLDSCLRLFVHFCANL